MKKIIASGFSLYTAINFRSNAQQKYTMKPSNSLPFKSRNQHLQQVKDTPKYDMVIIGGGSVGAGVLLDAATRGYKCLLVEAGDFSSGASSKSTKLIHGGVRYLQQVFELSSQPFSHRIEKFNLVRQALTQRSIMIDNAPYMNHKISIVIPCRNSFWSAYYYIGSVFYHLVYKIFAGKSNVSFNFPFFAGRQDLRTISKYISDKYQSGVVYEDGQFNDSQMNLALLLTATVPHPKVDVTPANILNRVAATGLIKQDGKVAGAILKDQVTGQEMRVQSDFVVNCTGVFADSIRRMDDPNIFKRIIPVAGSHMTYDKQLVSRSVGVCIPSSDGRIILVLPWLGKTIVGTTEKTFQEPTNDPTMSYEEKQFIAKQLLDSFDKLSVKTLNNMHSSSWTGLRPLVLEEGAKDTKSISRKHVIEKSKSGLFSLMGGKWTTYRKMAEDLMDQVEKERLKKAGNRRMPCKTKELPLIGCGMNDKQLKYLYDEYSPGLVNHLYTNYGNHLTHILDGNLQMLDQKTLITKAQIDYIVKYRMPMTIEDVLLRRTRIAFLQNSRVDLIAPYVAEALARQHGWTRHRKQQELKKFQETYEKLQF